MELGTNWLSGDDRADGSPLWDTTVASVVLTTGGWEPSAGSAGRPVGPQDDSELEDRSTPLGLTVREINVLRLVGEGYSLSGIAATLSYSESTIKKVLHEAMRQVGARNRTHAVAIALRAKVI
jgi:DNA-binding NarL/FixJ family response regulator